jgi:L,D-peptidoglycan transpeptidase YkuD (ErfK/YbiS/YcfS/YnhG family)
MINKAKIYTYLLAAFVFCLVSSLCESSTCAADDVAAGWMQSCLEKLAGESSQVLLVVGEGSSTVTAKLYVLEKKHNTWRIAFSPLPALIGGNGFAPPGEKKEGDVRTPSGVFALKRAFGYAAKIDTRLSYQQAGADDIWVDDITSPDYNRCVRKGETSAASFENMKLNDDRYKYGIVIEYNTDPIVKGAGSAIFIHVRRKGSNSTMGCVALSESDVLKVLGWLDPKRKPLAVLGTRDSIVLLAKGQRVSSDCLASGEKR